jgi:hypothetical protein
MYRKSKVISEKRYNREIKKAPSIYLIVHYARWCIVECKLAGFKRNIFGRPKSPLIPLIYKYNDHNGERETFLVCPYSLATSGGIHSWHYDIQEAEFMLTALRLKEDN